MGFRSLTKTRTVSHPDASPTVFLVAEIGVGIRYFCQTPLVAKLLDRGLHPVVVVPNTEEVLGVLSNRRHAVPVERLRVDLLDEAFDAGRFRKVRSLVYACVNYLRVAGMSRRINLAAARDARMLTERRWMRTRSRLRMIVPVLREAGTLLSKRRWTRSLFERVINRRPLDRFHPQLFERYSPDLVVTSGPGWWPSEELFLREARERNVPTLAVVTGWDHASSKGLPGARPDRIAVWSSVQRSELVHGSDFNQQSVDVCGPVHFDGYRDESIRVPRAEYMRRHGLDPSRRLITFGCSFVGLSPNFIIVKALAEAVAANAFGVPAQLLVRLHPSHLKSAGKYTEVRREADQYYELAAQFPNVRIDTPILGKSGVPNYTNPEDAASLASLFAHSDVLVTLFSTMVLESCFNDVPVVAAAFDPPSSDLDDFLPITKALDWPTHERIIRSGAAAIVSDAASLVAAVRRYLEDPKLHSEERRAFAKQECSFLDGQCAERLAALIDGLARGAEAPRVIRDRQGEASRHLRTTSLAER